MDFGNLMENLYTKIKSFFAYIGELVSSTGMPEQIKDVDIAGLFANPWFLIPFIGLIIYLLYKKSFKELIIVAMIGGGWYLGGTEYMQTLIVGDELQVEKVLPLLFGGTAALALVIYLFFIRSD